MKETIYYKQVRLLLKILPLVHKEKKLALKGGTAINLFFREVPRLSVDIDLAYLPIEKRDLSLIGISNVLSKLAKNIYKFFPNTIVKERKLNNTDFVNGLFIQEEGTLVKLEVNTTIRGSVNPPVEISLSDKASELFEMDVTVQSLSFDEVYAGKMCAALDRQHPRDFYDIKLLLENEGISDNLRRTFLVYLISNNRPIVELLNPNLIDFEKSFRQEFVGMTRNNVSLNELTESREKLIKEIHSALKNDEKEFLLLVKSRKPNWKLLGFENIENLPAVQWKMLNLNNMSNEKHAEAFRKLKMFLDSLH